MHEIYPFANSAATLEYFLLGLPILATGTSSALYPLGILVPATRLLTFVPPGAGTYHPLNHAPWAVVRTQFPGNMLIIVTTVPLKHGIATDTPACSDVRAQQQPCVPAAKGPPRWRAQAGFPKIRSLDPQVPTCRERNTEYCPGHVVYGKITCHPLCFLGHIPGTRVPNTRRPNTRECPRTPS